ncbi:hypothetical protein IscW_ISCW010453 [Ixodes scapularis]|uniref:Uncharacterized protein n=1 Tax=Ixodes scapularis TaxID=6945 RepID=B7Q8Z9_IXOSC|nr:hypothetical protein IscW_ISCW010453 [Ixodes scapularis]|eukprot:XP_002405502.1 hypothetical protein IscW_ISCW010453 [Ixodes scapularis]
MTPRVGSALQVPSSIEAGLPLADWPWLRAAAGRSPWGEPGEEQRLDRVTIRPEDSRSPRGTQAAGYLGASTEASGMARCMVTQAQGFSGAAPVRQPPISPFFPYFRWQK